MQLGPVSSLPRGRVAEFKPTECGRKRSHCVRPGLLHENVPPGVLHVFHPLLTRHLRSHTLKTAQPRARRGRDQTTDEQVLGEELPANMLNLDFIRVKNKRHRASEMLGQLGLP